MQTLFSTTQTQGICRPRNQTDGRGRDNIQEHEQLGKSSTGSTEES